MRLGNILHLLGTFFPIFLHQCCLLALPAGNGSLHASYAVVWAALPGSKPLRKPQTGRPSFQPPLEPGPLSSVPHPVMAAIFSPWSGEARSDVGLRHWAGGLWE